MKKGRTAKSQQKRKNRRKSPQTTESNQSNTKVAVDPAVTKTSIMKAVMMINKTIIFRCTIRGKKKLVGRISRSIPDPQMARSQWTKNKEIKYLNTSKCSIKRPTSSPRKETTGSVQNVPVAPAAMYRNAENLSSHISTSNRISAANSNRLMTCMGRRCRRFSSRRSMWWDRILETKPTCTAAPNSVSKQLAWKPVLRRTRSWAIAS